MAMVVDLDGTEVLNTGIHMYLHDGVFATKGS